MRIRALLTWTATILTACGAAQVQSHLATPSPAVMASATRSAGPTVLLVVQTKAAVADQPGSLTLFSTDGKPVGIVALKPGTGVLAVAGARIFVRTADGSLEAVHKDGSTEVLDATPGTLSGIGLVTSPDGTRWVWGSQTTDPANRSVFIAGDGLPKSKLATNPCPTLLEAYAWNAEGVIVDCLPADYVGYRPFETLFGETKFGGVRLLNLHSGSLQPMPNSNGCIFNDEARDGSIACFPTDAGYIQPNQHTVRIISSGGKTTDLSLAVPRFNYVGDAFFSPDGSMLTVAGATGVGLSLVNGQPSSINPELEQYATDLVQVGDGSIARFGPSGVRPAMGRQSWLPDGRLVLWRPNTIGGPAGLYVLDPHGGGQGPETEVTGTPLGYLSG